jgi:hypothetical protein
MRFKTLIVVGTLLAATSAFAQNNPQAPTPPQGAGSQNTGSAPATGTMKQSPTGMGTGQSGAAPSSTPRGRAGAGEGTTGTGQKGGSGNE